MLQHLHIENYALIECLDIDFYEGFSVITGETGAGKSILLGAIGLLTGGRADLSAIQVGKQRCILEATFSSIGQSNIEDFFKDEDLDYDPNECIIRRELTSNGKSRAFINDTPTSVSALKRLGSMLIDIHSQHQNLMLGQENFQISILDTLSGNAKLLNSYSQVYNNWKKLIGELQDAQNSLNNGRKDEEYLRFLANELETLRPLVGEDEVLHQQCDILEHSQDIKFALMQGYTMLNDGDNPVTDTIRQVKNQLSAIEQYFPEATDLSERLESCRLEILDIASTMESKGEDIDYNPETLEKVQSRLNMLYSLEQKHHVKSSDELIAVMSDIHEKLNIMDNSDEYIQELEIKVREAKNQVEELASQLTQEREHASKIAEQHIIDNLKILGMPNVQFKADITHTTEPTSTGMDKVTFLFSANLGSPMQDISQIASGGEIARVMLSLKALLSGTISFPTIVFDEIDTGVSGHIAESMAEIMVKIAKQGRQVISITHLPQIASKGQQHYKVWKEDTDSITRSYITILDIEKRIKEIANMLSGSNVSVEAINNARALLDI